MDEIIETRQRTADTPPSGLSSDAVKSSYRRYARVYDTVFGFSLEAGRRQALEYLKPTAGTRVLEIGVGTGLSLPLYPAGVQITGVDLSPEMLAQARRRAERMALREVELFAMDASALTFEDDSFDVSVAMYVASVAPDPAAIVSEMRRVTRPGGQLVIVNHFTRRGTLMSGVERLLSPLAPVIGFQPVFCLDRFLRSTGLTDARVIPVRPFGYWLLIVAQNEK